VQSAQKYVSVDYSVHDLKCDIRPIAHSAWGCEVRI